MIDDDLKRYVEEEIVPRYDEFDAAHRRDHALMVIEHSLAIINSGETEVAGVDENMVYAVAAYHDTGLSADRKTHHIVSGNIVRSDECLARWFTPEQIETIAQACEDHRASSDHEPRTIYGKIVAEADRFIDPDTIIRRTVQYGLTNYPELDKEDQWQRTLEHLGNKYAEGGYLRLWFANSPNAARLEALREIISDRRALQAIFDRYYHALTTPTSIL